MKSKNPMDSWNKNPNMSQIKNDRSNFHLQEDIESGTDMLEDLIMDDFLKDDPKELFKPNVVKYSELTKKEQIEHDIRAFYFLSGVYKDDPNEHEAYARLLQEMYGNDKNEFKKSADAGQKTLNMSPDLNQPMPMNVQGSGLQADATDIQSQIGGNTNSMIRKSNG